MGRGDNGGVRHRRGVADSRIGLTVEGAVEVDRGEERAVRRVRRLDHVGRGDFGRRAGVEGIGPVPAIQGVDAAIAAQNIGVGVAGEGVRKRGADNFLNAGQGVSALARGGPGSEVDRHARPRAGKVCDVPPVAAVQSVVADPADQRVVARAAVQHIVARPAIQGVIAVQPVDRIVAAAAADSVGEGRAGDRLTGRVARHQKAACRRRGDGLVGELQELDVGDRIGPVRPDHRADLAVPRDGVLSPVAREHDRVGAEAAVDHVVPAVARDPVVARVAPDLIIARSADRILDDGTHGDAHIADQRADAGEGALAQVDDLVLVVSREVERVIAARVPDREDQQAGPAGRVEPGPISRGVEAVDRVAGAGGGVDAIEPLGRGDVVHERDGGKVLRVADAVVAAGEGLGKIAHQRVLTAVLEIFRIGGIGDAGAGAGIVGAGVAQADGMADLVRQDLLTVQEVRRRGVVAERVVDPDVALDRAERGGTGGTGGTGQIGEGRRPVRTGGVVSEQDGCVA